MKHDYKKYIFLFNILFLLLFFSFQESKAQRFRFLIPQTVYVPTGGDLDLEIIIEAESEPDLILTSSNQTVIKDANISASLESSVKHALYTEYRFRITAIPELNSDPSKAVAYVELKSSLKGKPEKGTIERLLAVKFGGGKLPDYARMDYGQLKEAPYNLMENNNFESAIKAPNPVFVDIDGDGDLDCFSGAAGVRHNSWGSATYNYANGKDEQKGLVYFLENTGDVNNPSFSNKIESPFNIVLPDKDRVNNYYYPALTFGDLDGDGDKDLLVGFNSKASTSNTETGGVLYYENIGSVTNPIFQYREKNPFGLSQDTDVNGYSDFFPARQASDYHWMLRWQMTRDVTFKRGQSEFNIISPTLVDLDGDGLLDLFISTGQGTFHYFMNEGSSLNPQFNERNDFVSDPTASNRLHYRDGGIYGLPIRDIIQWDVSSSFLDIDKDGDPDLLIGNYDYGITYFENIAGIGASEPEFDPELKPLFPFYSKFETNKTFTNPEDGIAVLHYQTVTVADLNGDGVNEIYTGRRSKGYNNSTLNYGLFYAEPKKFEKEEVKSLKSSICSEDLDNGNITKELDLGAIKFVNFDASKYEIKLNHRLIGSEEAKNLIDSVKLVKNTALAVCTDGCEEYVAKLFLNEKIRDLKKNFNVGLNISAELIPKGLSTEVVLNSTYLEQAFNLDINYCGPPIGAIEGRVFEDLKYGHETLTTDELTNAEVTTYTNANPPRLLPIEGARVELYSKFTNTSNDPDLKFVDFTTTDSNGNYSFGKQNKGEQGLFRDDYVVRVVNTTVKSPVRAWDAVGVVTYYDDFTTDYRKGILDKVGGEAPYKIDLPSNIKSKSLVDLETSYPYATFSTMAEITIEGSEPNMIRAFNDSTELKDDVHFVFNFNTVVNANSEGQGSLDQMIQNTNSLDRNYNHKGSLVTLDHQEKSWFRIPNVSGVDATNYNWTGDYYTIMAPSTGFTPLVKNAIIDGSTQFDIRNQLNPSTNQDSLFRFRVLDTTKHSKISEPKLLIKLNGTDIDPSDASAMLDILPNTDITEAGLRGFYLVHSNAFNKVAVRLSAENFIVEGNIFGHGSESNGTHVQVFGGKSNHIGTDTYPNIFGASTNHSIDFKLNNNTLPKNNIVKNNAFGRYPIDSDSIGLAISQSISVGGEGNEILANHFSKITRTAIHVKRLGSGSDLESGLIQYNYIEDAETAIRVDTYVNNYVIGGVLKTEMNAIFDVKKAIAVGDVSTGVTNTSVTILPNHIEHLKKTGSFSIDLENNDFGAKNPDGTLFRATANDFGDLDQGPNELLNYLEIQDPVILVKDKTTTTAKDSIEFDIKYSLPKNSDFRIFYYKDKIESDNEVPESSGLFSTDYIQIRRAANGGFPDKKIPYIQTESPLQHLFKGTNSPLSVDYLTSKTVEINNGVELEEQVFIGKYMNSLLSAQEIRAGVEKFYGASSELSDPRKILELPDIKAKELYSVSQDNVNKTINVASVFTNIGSKKNKSDSLWVGLFWGNPTVSASYNRIASQVLLPLDSGQLDTLYFNDIKFPCSPQELFVVANVSNTLTGQVLEVGGSGGQASYIKDAKTLEAHYDNNVANLSITNTLPFDLNAPSVADVCLGDTVEIKLSGLVNNAKYTLSYLSRTLIIERPVASDTTILVSEFNAATNPSVSLSGESLSGGCTNTKSTTFTVSDKTEEIVFGAKDSFGEEIKDYEICVGEEFEFSLEKFNSGQNYYVYDHKNDLIGTVYKGNDTDNKIFKVAYSDLIASAYDHRFSSTTGIDLYKLKIETSLVDAGGSQIGCTTSDTLNLSVYGVVNPDKLTDIEVCDERNLQIPVEVKNAQVNVSYWLEKTGADILIPESEWGITTVANGSVNLIIKPDDFNPRRISLGKNDITLRAKKDLLSGHSCRVSLDTFQLDLKQEPKDLELGDLAICQDDNETTFGLNPDSLILNYTYTLYEYDTINDVIIKPALDSKKINTVSNQSLKVQKTQLNKSRYQVHAESDGLGLCEKLVGDFWVTEKSDFKNTLDLGIDTLCSDTNLGYINIKDPELGVDYRVYADDLAQIALNTNSNKTDKSLAGIDSLTFDLPAGFTSGDFVYIQATVNNSACSYLYPAKITLLAAPTNQETVSIKAVCENEDTDLIIGGLPLDYSNYTYSLRDDLGDEILPSTNLISAGEYFFTLDYAVLQSLKNSNSKIHVFKTRKGIKEGCEIEIADRNVIINPVPSVNPGNFTYTPVCQGSQGEIQINNAGTYSFDLLSSANDALISSSMGNKLIIPADSMNALSKDFKIRITSDKSCEQIIDKTLTALAVPTRTNLALIGDEICEGDTASITISDREKDVVYSVYNVLNLSTPVRVLATEEQANGTATDLVLKIRPTALGANRYKIRAGLNTCSVDLDSEVTVEVNEPATLAFDLIEQCLNTSDASIITLKPTTYEADYSYKISGNGINKNLDIASESFDVGVLNAQTDFTITANKISGGCIVTKDLTVTPLRKPNFTATPASEKCIGSATQIDITNATQGDTIVLRKNGAEILRRVVDSRNTAQLPVDAIYMQTTPFDFEIQAISKNGCLSDVSSLSLTVLDIPSISSTISAGNSCVEGTAYLNINPRDASVAYAIYDIDNTTQYSGFTKSSDNTVEFAFDKKTAGDYEVIVKIGHALDQNCIFNFDTTTIKVLPIPAKISTSLVDFCEDSDEVEVSVSSTEADMNYAVLNQIGGQVLYNASNALLDRTSLTNADSWTWDVQKSDLTTGMNYVPVRIQRTESDLRSVCEVYDSLEIQKNPLPKVDDLIIKDPTVCMGDGAEIIIQNPVAGETYTLTAATISRTFDATGKALLTAADLAIAKSYTLRAENTSTACVATRSLAVTVQVIDVIETDKQATIPYFCEVDLVNDSIKTKLTIQTPQSDVIYKVYGINGALIDTIKSTTTTKVDLNIELSKNDYAFPTAGNIKNTYELSVTASTQDGSCTYDLDDKVELVLVAKPQMENVIGDVVCVGEIAEITVENAKFSTKNYNVYLRGETNPLTIVAQQDALNYKFPLSALSTAQTINYDLSTTWKDYSCYSDIKAASVTHEALPTLPTNLGFVPACEGETENVIAYLISSENVDYTLSHGTFTQLGTASSTRADSILFSIPRTNLNTGATTSFDLTSKNKTSQACTELFASALHVNLTPMPQDKTVTLDVNTSSICVGGTAKLLIQSSQVNVNYDIYISKKGSAVLSDLNKTVLGNGALLEVEVTLDETTYAGGVYEFIVKAGQQKCGIELSDKAELNILSKPQEALFTAPAVCSNSNAVIELTNAETNVDYTLYRSDLNQNLFNSLDTATIGEPIFDNSKVEALNLNAPKEYFILKSARTDVASCVSSDKHFSIEVNEAPTVSPIVPKACEDNEAKVIIPDYTTSPNQAYDLENVSTGNILTSSVDGTSLVFEIPASSLNNEFLLTTTNTANSCKDIQRLTVAKHSRPVLPQMTQVESCDASFKVKITNLSMDYFYQLVDENGIVKARSSEVRSTTSPLSLEIENAIDNHAYTLRYSLDIVMNTCSFETNPLVSNLRLMDHVNVFETKACKDDDVLVTMDSPLQTNVAYFIELRHGFLLPMNDPSAKTWLVPADSLSDGLNQLKVIGKFQSGLACSTEIGESKIEVINLSASIDDLEACLDLSTTLSVQSPYPNTTYILKGHGLEIESVNNVFTIPTNTAGSFQYEVYAKYASLTCEQFLKDTVRVEVYDQINQSLTIQNASQDVCFDTQSTSVTIENPQAGMTYWVIDASGTKRSEKLKHSDISQTSIDIPFNLPIAQSGSFTYSVMAGREGLCEATLDQGIMITIELELSDVSLTFAPNDICDSEEDVKLLLSNTQADVSYDLYLNDVFLDSQTATTDGSVLEFPVATSHLSAGILSYKIIKENAADCKLEQLGSVSVKPLPRAVSISDTVVCSGSDAFIRLSNVVSGVRYKILDGAVTISGELATSNADLILNIDETHLDSNPSADVLTNFKLVLESDECELIQDFAVKVLSKPNLNIQLDVLSVCEKTTEVYKLKILNPELNVKYKIEDDAGNSISGDFMEINPSDSTISLTDVGNLFNDDGTLKIVIQVKKGDCPYPATGLYQITVNPIPSLTLRNALEVCAGVPGFNLPVDRPESHVLYNVLQNSISLLENKSASQQQIDQGILNLYVEDENQQFILPENVLFKVLAKNSFGCETERSSNLKVNRLPDTVRFENKPACIGELTSRKVDNVQAGDSIRLIQAGVVLNTFVATGTSLDVLVPGATIMEETNDFEIERVSGEGCVGSTQSIKIIGVKKPLDTFEPQNLEICDSDAPLLEIANAELGVVYQVYGGQNGSVKLLGESVTNSINSNLIIELDKTIIEEIFDGNNNSINAKVFAKRGEATCSVEKIVNIKKAKTPELRAIDFETFECDPFIQLRIKNPQPSVRYQLIETTTLDTLNEFTVFKDYNSYDLGIEIKREWRDAGFVNLKVNAFYDGESKACPKVIKDITKVEIIADTEAPVFVTSTFPLAQDKVITGAATGALVNWTLPEAEDCNLDSVWSETIQPNTFVELGFHKVPIKAVDLAGNTVVDTLNLFVHKGYNSEGIPPVVSDTLIYVKKAAIENINILLGAKAGSSAVDSTLVFFQNEDSLQNLSGTVKRILISQNGVMFTVFQYQAPDVLGQREESFDYYVLDRRNRKSNVATVTIRLIDDVFIPKFFTPNNDGANDTFVIKGAEDYKNNKIKIYNRWGVIVYEKESYTQEWGGENGTDYAVGGKELPEATYFYIFDKGDGSDPIKGYVYIKRK